MSVEVIRHEDLAVSYIDNTSGQVTSEPAVQNAIGKLGRELANWVSDIQGGTRRGGASLINRQAYNPPTNPYASMMTAYQAVENDDVISGVADVTEGLMFQDLGFESDDQAETDVFNQIARDLNLDGLARQWHREEYIYSQVVMGVWWGRREYTPRLKTGDKRARASKKKYAIATPVAVTFLDPRRVVPLQPGPFGQDRLAWAATKDEYTNYVLSWQTGGYGDALMREFLTGPTNLEDKGERSYLSGMGIQVDYLININPSTVIRYSRTKSHYERFPSLRLKSTFPLLDLKQQLMEADRVTLVGAANFILLVRQGSKEEPATQGEIDNLQENFKVVAKVPVVVGDHRLQIDIITPSQEHVLESNKYDTLDRRIISRALGALTIASSGQRNENSLSIARGIARLLESRRKMFQRFMEEHLVRSILEHPANVGIFKGSDPSLAFTPRNIQLDSDADFLKSVLAMRTMNELSRQSMLETFGFDQAVEAMRREIEAEPGGYDDIFQTHVPFDSPTGDPNADPNAKPSAEGTGEPAVVSGARGGRPKGGGTPKKSVDGM